MKANTAVVVLVGLLVLQAMASTSLRKSGTSVDSDNAVAKKAASEVHKSAKKVEVNEARTGWDDSKVVGGKGKYQEKGYTYKGPDSAHDKGFEDHASAENKATASVHDVDNTFTGVNDAAYYFPNPVVYTAPAYNYGTPGYGGVGYGYDTGYGGMNGYGVGAGYDAGYGGYGYGAGYPGGY